MPRRYKNSLFSCCTPFNLRSFGLCRSFNNILYFETHSHQVWKRLSVPVFSLAETITASNMATMKATLHVIAGAYLGAYLQAAATGDGFFR